MKKTLWITLAVLATLAITFIGTGLIAASAGVSASQSGFSRTSAHHHPGAQPSTANFLLNSKQ